MSEEYFTTSFQNALEYFDCEEDVTGQEEYITNVALDVISRLKKFLPKTIQNNSFNPPNMIITYLDYENLIKNSLEKTMNQGIGFETRGRFVNNIYFKKFEESMIEIYFKKLEERPEYNEDLLLNLKNTLKEDHERIQKGDILIFRGTLQDMFEKKDTLLLEPHYVVLDTIVHEVEHWFESKYIRFEEDENISKIIGEGTATWIANHLIETTKWRKFNPDISGKYYFEDPEEENNFGVQNLDSNDFNTFKYTGIAYLIQEEMGQTPDPARIFNKTFRERIYKQAKDRWYELEGRR